MNYAVRRLARRSVVILRPQEALSKGIVCVRTLSSSSHSGSSTTLIELQPDSSRSKFKATAADPSILKYIESIGVGIPKRNHTKRRKQKRTRRKSQFMSVGEEKQELRPVRRAVSGTPPPPFAAPSADNHTDKSESEQRIKRLPVKLIGSVGSRRDKVPLASKGLAEVAIAGRSNVGKSTLLNALLYGNSETTLDSEKVPAFRNRNRATSRTAKLPKGLKAVASSKPGQTRTLDFYQLSSLVDNNKVSLMLVDLPGYGFAFAKEEKIQGWKLLMQDYILHRGKALKRILFLIDSRHGMKKADIEFLVELQKAMYESRNTESEKTKSSKRELPPIQIVLTKADLVKQADLARRVVQVRQQLSDCLIRQPSALPFMMTSAQMEGQAGVLELQKELASLVNSTGSLKKKKAPDRKQ